MVRAVCALALVASAAGLSMSPNPGTKLVQTPVENKKQERRRIMKSETFLRSNSDFVAEKAAVDAKMLAEMKSALLDDMRAQSFETTKGQGNAAVTFRLAKEYGMCWGAERSIELALAAAARFADKKMHITNELLHNPGVNKMLEDSGIEFMEKTADGGKRFDNVKPGDVVILPAFGATLEEMQHFDALGVTTVDTTCPWVSKVWNVVDKQVSREMTTVIHGKYGHEEAIATASYCKDYLMVKDIHEAEYVCNYILGTSEAARKEDFMAKFSKAMSAGFDPDKHLKKVGIANQTTMYKKETSAIGKLFEKTMIAQFGPDEANERFAAFDTICDATQERQDAMLDLIHDPNVVDLDFILVVGGFDSSNTAHLVEIPHGAGIRSYHINEASCIGADNSVKHRLVDGSIITDANWLNFDRPMTIGITSGASTPDAYVQECLEAIILLKSLNSKM
ncbi:LytB protein-domain-containing protein [Pelagophyceae sp. CCMP2097]|nr:LytB protein-domain-containing protein [Pelagophyceae sp. CCMP2097]|mmetsp:Transcript_22750/g.79034  ORF Transcript_22750/g.79034 Transcript_22750/m.79034 type:complete len:451 (-) Transcript_22750:124-1476(-)